MMKKEINVLLFGPSGYGKSTFLNSLNMVVRYRTLEDALGDDSKIAIPVRFSHNRRQISEGHDENERQVDGGSRTARPRIYLFPAEEITLRIIDTPGIGDTEGAEQDQKHIGHILSCITQFDQIHGVLFFFKSTDNRLSTFLSYQLIELFSCLGKAAINNIRFVITHATPQCEPGEADTVINAFLETMRLNMSATEENTFCVENQAFFYLVGIRNPENRYRNSDRSYYQMVYENTAKEYLRLLRNLYQCDTPYDVRNMTALKESRQLWPFLTPILDSLDKKEKEIKEAIKSHDVNLERLMLHIASDTTKLVKLEVEKYKEKVKKEKWIVEEHEVDVKVPDIKWKSVIEKVPFPRIEHVERQRNVTKYDLVNDTVEEEVTKPYIDYVQKERSVERWRRVGSGGGPNLRDAAAGATAGALAGSVVPVVGTILGGIAGALFGASRSTQQESWEPYTDKESYEAPVVKEKKEKVQKQVQRVVKGVEKESYLEPVVKEDFREVSKRKPEIVYNTEKKIERVPKKEEVFEEEEKERIKKITDPEVQKKIKEQEVKKRAEENERARLAAKCKQYDVEMQQIRDLTYDFARVLHENNIVGLNSAVGQYLEAELRVERSQNGESKKAKWLRDRLAEAKTTAATLDQTAIRSTAKRPLLTPVELQNKVKQLCNLQNFGELLKDALKRCEEYDSIQFRTIVLQDAAGGYMFEEMAERG